eukprot:976942-Amphidinium_carterae.2
MRSKLPKSSLLHSVLMTGLFSVYHSAGGVLPNTASCGAKTPFVVSTLCACTALVSMMSAETFPTA